MNRRTRQIISVVVVLAVAGTAAYYVINHYSSGSGSPLIVYSADAYVQETQSLLNDYHNSSGVQVAPVKGGGSLTDARQIGQGNPSDVFVSVSLASYGKSYLQSRYSGWAVAFAADQMVLAYSSATVSNSTSSGIINEFSSALKSNSTSQFNGAFLNLTSGKVKVGIANPSSDPAGYRGWLVLEIAGSLYHSDQSYYMNRLSRNGGNVSASDAASLVSPLDSGQIQFLFIYRSAAIVKGLHYIQLPSDINLGSVNYSGFYSGFSYDLPSGSVTAAPIFLYVSALNNSTDMSQALGFSEYILNNTAKLSAFGLTPMKPELLYSSGPIPAGISAMVKAGRISSAGGI